MKERPILFNAPMVRAILAGSKTQTRRALRKGTWWTPGHGVVRMAPAGLACTGIAPVPCPFGRLGDLLWVREAWRTVAEADGTRPRDMNAGYRFWFEADAPHQPGYGKLRQARFMPRWASRFTLEVTGVRVERLQDISRGDSMAEGCPFPNMAKGDDPRKWYADLWEQINGHGSWDANPWVWVIEFRRVEGLP